MSFQPDNWNAIVIGAWNPAILTPDWIGREVFQVPTGKMVSLEVPVNTPGPLRVTHEGVGVLVGPGSLEFACEAAEYPKLELAMKLACRTLDLLPITPLVAAGFNLRYKSDELAPELAALVRSGLDRSFSDASFRLIGTNIRKAIGYEGGVINCEISLGPDQSTLITLNFHLGSNARETLKAWLSRPIDEVKTTTERILGCLKGVTLE